MQTIKILNDVKLFYIQATSFPDGIKDAFNKLENSLPTKQGREFYGIYEENENGISYKAAVLEQFKNEGDKYSCKYFILEKGKYLSESINNWETKIEKIGETFDKMFEMENVNPKSPSIEHYKTLNELVCMVKLND